MQVEPMRLLNVTQKIALNWGEDAPVPHPPVARPEATVLKQLWSVRPDAVYLLAGML